MLRCQFSFAVWRLFSHALYITATSINVKFTRPGCAGVARHHCCAPQNQICATFNCLPFCFLQSSSGGPIQRIGPASYLDDRRLECFAPAAVLLEGGVASSQATVERWMVKVTRAKARVAFCIPSAILHERLSWRYPSIKFPLLLSSPNIRLLFFTTCLQFNHCMISITLLPHLSSTFPF